MNQKVDDVEKATNSNLGENNTDYEAPKSQNGESNQNKELRPGTGRLIYQQNESGKAETNTITGETAKQTFDTKRTRKPNYKGAINLDGKKLILSAWINVSKKGKGRFLSLLASIKYKDNVENKDKYKKVGKGFLRCANQNSPKDPKYRGELEIDNGNKLYSLSAWSNFSPDNPQYSILFLNSRLMEKPSFQDKQKEMKYHDNNR